MQNIAVSSETFHYSYKDSVIICQKNRNKRGRGEGAWEKEGSRDSPAAVLASSALAFLTCSLRTSRTTQRICARQTEWNSKIKRYIYFTRFCWVISKNKWVKSDKLWAVWIVFIPLKLAAGPRWGCSLCWNIILLPPALLCKTLNKEETGRIRILWVFGPSVLSISVNVDLWGH